MKTYKTTEVAAGYWETEWSKTMELLSRGADDPRERIRFQPGDRVVIDGCGPIMSVLGRGHDRGTVLVGSHWHAPYGRLTAVVHESAGTPAAYPFVRVSQAVLDRGEL